MTKEEIIEMAHKSGLHLATDVNWMPIIGLEYLEKFSKLVAEKAVEEANHIIFKSCTNQPHWKRSAMRYLKRNAPMLHHQAVHEFNEHPDGRGQE